VNEKQFRDRAERVREAIEHAAARAGRAASDVLVLPVTKGHPPDVIRAVASLGFEAIGENRVGEADAKQAELGRMGLKWHMIGHLQRNKAGRAVELFDAIESVDSLRLARRLQLDAERRSREDLPILVQVNAGGEEQKGGFELPETVDAVGRILELDRLRVEGIMTMAPYTNDETVLRGTFTRARECLERCRAEIPEFLGSRLSMGMSNDFEIAVEEGSTELRLGTVLLGERSEV
jgi:pyridoxal phosphate enzyme (YggS family)